MVKETPKAFVLRKISTLASGKAYSIPPHTVHDMGMNRKTFINWVTSLGNFDVQAHCGPDKAFTVKRAFSWSDAFSQIASTPTRRNNSHR